MTTIVNTTKIVERSVRRKNGGYVGRISVFDGNRQLGVYTSPVVRLSRGDARMDARQMAHDLLVENGLRGLQ